MKKLTVGFLIFLVLALAGTVTYLLVGPDFTAPAAIVTPDEDPDAPVWDLTIEDLMAYLEEKGFWDPEDALPISEGVADKAFVSQHVEIYWWNLKDPNEDSPEYRAYMDMLETGQIDLYGKGLWFIPITMRGTSRPWRRPSRPSDTERQGGRPHGKIASADGGQRPHHPF